MGGFSKSGLNHNEARTPEQKALMAQIEKDGVCPFCKEHFTTYHPKPIIKENDSWFLTENISPYEGTTHHFILVYKPEHIISPEQISPETYADFFELINWAIAEFSIQGGSFFMRFGEGDYNGSSVEHLHAQLLTGVKKGDDTEGLKVKLSYKNK